MTFEISCLSCGAITRSSGTEVTTCPSCGTPIEQMASDRRSPKDIPSIRDWVTSLRLTGADFSREAAIAAREAAWNARRNGGSEEDAFQSARVAYYDSLKIAEGRSPSPV